MYRTCILYHYNRMFHKHIKALSYILYKRNTHHPRVRGSRLARCGKPLRYDKWY